MSDFGSLGIAIKPRGPTEQRLPCPQCGKGPHDRALGANIETGAYNCFRCGLKGRVGKENSDPYRPIVRLDDPAVAERKRARLREIWKRSIHLTNPGARVVHNYLCSRGLAEVLRDPPKVLRAVTGLKYWDGSNELGEFPAMIALFQSAAGEPVTLHATYLRSDGCAKAAVPSPKKILGVPVKGATRGGAIHLHEPRNGALGLAEGIESALSLGLIERIPTWASFCADNLERVRLPTGLRELRIGVDIDATGKGEQVAQALAERVRRRNPRLKVCLVRPELDGPGDLNDELLNRRAR